MASERAPIEHHEGPEAWQRFDRTMDRVLKVSKEELVKREAAYQKSRANKDRPGPRRRVR